MLKRFIKIYHQSLLNYFFKVKRAVRYYYDSFIAFFLYGVKLFFVSLESKEQTILGIYNNVIPTLSLTDLILSIQYLSVLKENYNADKIDICIVLNLHGKQTISLYYDDKKVAPFDLLEYYPEYLKIFTLCPFLGSIYEFSSQELCDMFIKERNNKFSFSLPDKNIFNIEEYKKDINSFVVSQPFIFNSNVPTLRISIIDEIWAKNFFQKNLKKGSVPIAFILNYNELYSAFDLLIIKYFLNKCLLIYPEFHFCLFTLSGENVTSFADFPNVLLVNEYCPSLMQYYALMRSSLICIGDYCDLSAILLFTQTPFLLFSSNHIPCNRKPPQFSPFDINIQRIFLLKDRLLFDDLFFEFYCIINSLDVEGFTHSLYDHLFLITSHPSTFVLS